MIVKLVYDRKNLAAKKGTGLIQIVVYHNRRYKYISTGIHVAPSQWSGKIIRHPRAREFNEIIRRKVKSIQDFELSLARKGQWFTLERLEELMSAREPHSLAEFIEQQIDKGNISPSTKASERACLALIRRARLDFNDLDLERYTQQMDGLRQSTIHSYHKILRKYLARARKAELTDRDPYKNYTVRRGSETTIRYLTSEQLSKIRDKDLHIDRLRKVRDVFLFCCYTGMSYKDAESLTEKDLLQTGGEWWIRSRRVKTSREYNIMLLPPAIKILEKYSFSLPMITNSKYNAYLKEIAVLCEIDVNLSSHVARHTFAVFLLNEGVPIEVVSKMLGHRSIKTTEIYAKVLQKSIREHMTRLKDLFTEK